MYDGSLTGQAQSSHTIGEIEARPVAIGGLSPIRCGQSLFVGIDSEMITIALAIVWQPFRCSVG